MPGNDAIQCLLQCGHIQHAVQVHAARQGVGLRGAVVELRQEPQPLLREGQGQWRVAVGWHDGRQRAGGSGIQRLRQLGQTWLREQRG